VTERKPKGMTWESWAERQVRVAAEQGVFDDLPGMGKPLPPSTEDEWDPDWWVKQKMAREQISYVPPGLQLRKDLEDALDNLGRLPSEGAARKVLEELNQRIIDSNRMAHSGPPANLMPLDVGRFVQIWRDAQPPPPTAPPAPSPPAAGRRKWRRASRPSR
jgi:hypothetical protein